MEQRASNLLLCGVESIPDVLSQEDNLVLAERRPLCWHKSARLAFRRPHRPRHDSTEFSGWMSVLCAVWNRDAEYPLSDEGCPDLEADAEVDLKIVDRIF